MTNRKNPNAWCEDGTPRFPHCDSAVLHAPGECEFCDLHPDWQWLREHWGINFTGHNDPKKSKCPAETRRSLAIINRWGGNVPETAERKAQREAGLKELLNEAKLLREVEMGRQASRDSSGL